MKAKALPLFLLVVFLLPCFALPTFAQPEAALYVAPAGDNAAPGTFDAPLATPGGALAYLQANAARYANGGTVYFRAGEYTLAEPLSFTEALPKNITFCAYKNEAVTFTAAVPLTGFAETQVNGVRAFCLQTELRFWKLYHPAREITTPRWPEKGSFTVKSVDHADDLFTESTTYWDASRGNTSFNADVSEVGLVFSQPEAVFCRITHAWLDEIAPIRFYDESTGKVGLGRPATYAVSPGDVYWFENVFEALDAPGEWYLDEAAGTLYYVPFEGETAEDLTLYAPVSAYLLNVDGCSGLRFENIRFFGTEWTLSVPPADAEVRSKYNIDAYQASTESDAAIHIQNANGIVFANCEFTDIGNTAVKYIKNCHNCTVQNCIFRRIGSTALAVYGENVPPDAENAAEAMDGFRIENNLIEAYGRNTYESTGVHLMYVKDSLVRHNEICNGYYTGLSCGWIWGHEYQVTKNIEITENLIYDIGQGWLSDLGGMYLLGEQPGTVIARNVIYNVTRGKGANDYGGNGIYTDAGSSFFTIEQNLIYDCAANGLNIGGYNRDHTVRNNIVAYCKLSAFDPGWGDLTPEDHTCNCTGNIFYADNAPVILDVSESAKFTESGNLLWDETNGKNVFGSDGYSGDYAKKTKIGARFAKMNGFFIDDTVADPLFKDPENRDFTLLPGSPALTGIIDFTPFDYSAAGTLPEVALGCGAEYTRGAWSRVSDLSAYENACSSPRFPYAFTVFGKRIAPVFIVLLLVVCAALGVIAAVRKKALSKPKRVLCALYAPVMLAALYPLYLSYAAAWKPALYAMGMLLFLIPAAVAPWLALRRIPAKIVFALLQAALFFAVTVTLNNVFRMGEDLALFTGELLTALPVLVFTALFFRRISERKQ